MTRANRDYLKKLNIEHRGEPLGRRKKDKHGNNNNTFARGEVYKKREYVNIRA
jgi:hypothetical protein